MLDFAGNSFKKRALKKAIKEINKEDFFKQHASIEKIEPFREYKTKQEADDYKVLKRNNALSKPQTEAVDLKHFKDWRKVDEVESKNQKYTPKKNFLFDGDDEGEQPEIGAPIGTNKNDLVNKIASINKSKEKEENKDFDFSSFFKEKYKKQDVANVANVDEAKPQTNKSSSLKTTSIRDQVKTNLNELMQKRASQSLDVTPIVKEKTQPETQSETQSETKSIKVEVVDFTEKKEAPSTKEVANVKKLPVKRKPRGKNKRRFDADVISSIDWK